MANHTYHYGRRIEKHLYAFLRIFSGFKVRSSVDRDGDGNYDERTCPVHYGEMSRIVANVLRKNNTWTAYKLPLISGVLTSIELNPENRRSNFHEENVARLRETDGSRVVNRKIMGIPYRANVDLSLWCSNNDQMMQLLEQILLLFSPRLSMQVSENLIDWAYISEVELLSVASESNVPAGVDEQTLIYTLSFIFDFWLDFPQIEQTNIINEIITNIKDNTIQSDGITLDTFTVDQNTSV